LSVPGYNEARSPPDEPCDQVGEIARVNGVDPVGVNVMDGLSTDPIGNLHQCVSTAENSHAAMLRTRRTESASSAAAHWFRLSLVNEPTPFFRRSFSADRSCGNVGHKRLHEGRLLIALALCFLSTVAMSADERPMPASKVSPRLLTIPTQIYPTVVNAKEGSTGWMFFLILEAADEGAITTSELTLTYLSNGKPVRTETLSATALLAVDKTNYPPARLTGTAPTQPTFWPHAFRLHASVPAALRVDALEALNNARHRGTAA